MRIRGTLRSLAMLTAANAHASDVTVHIEGDAHAELQLQIVREDGHWDWKTLCTTPCSVRAPGDGWYRVSGPNIIPSRSIALPKGDDVSLDAHATKWSDRSSGTNMIVVGGIIASAGAVTLVTAVVWALDLAFSHFRLFEPSEPYDSSGPAIAGAVGFGIVVVGAAILGNGAFMRRASRLSPASQNGF